MAAIEFERAAGFFPVQLMDGAEVRLPELSYGEASAWALRLATAFGPVFASYEREWQPGEGLVPIEAANHAAMETIIGFLVEYDGTGVLGGREGIAKRMSSSAIFRLYRLLYEEAHPFDADLSKALGQMAMQRVNAALARSDGASSTPGPSNTGVSPSETSPADSPPDSSRTTGPKGTGSTSARSASNSGSPTSPSGTRSSVRTFRRASGRRGGR